MMSPTYRYQTARPAKQQRGLTLIEILITVVILSVGLLGLAGLQVLGLKNINISGTHANAAILANELAERTHVNEDNIADYIGLTACNAASTAISDIDYCAVYTKATGDLNNDGDITDAGEKRLLRPSPDGTTLIAVTTCAACTAAGMHTITFSWGERDLTGTDVERTYSLNFMP
jgi:type IV pilus assembly protein PilV